MKPVVWTAIDVNEAVFLQFPFTNEMEVGETIVSIQPFCSVADGIDATPALSMVGAPILQGGSFNVLQLVQGRVAPVVYKFKLVATLSSGRKLARMGLLPVQDF